MNNLHLNLHLFDVHVENSVKHHQIRIRCDQGIPIKTIKDGMKLRLHSEGQLQTLTKPTGISLVKHHKSTKPLRNLYVSLSLPFQSIEFSKNEYMSNSFTTNIIFYIFMIFFQYILYFHYWYIL